MTVYKLHSLLSRVKAVGEASTGLRLPGLALLMNSMESADFDPYIKVLPVWGPLVS